MKFYIPVLGTRGDIQPYLALALGLKAKGHEVKIAAPINFKALVETYELKYAPIQIDFQELVGNKGGNRLISSNKNPFCFFSILRKVAKPLIQQVCTDIWLGAQESEAIIFSVMTYPAYFMAKDLGIPAFPTCLQPFIQTGGFPSPILPISRKLGSRLNRLSHQLVYQLYWKFTKDALHQWRASQQLPPIPSNNPFKEVLSSDIPFLCGVSQTIIPKPTDWQNNQHVNGYWFLEEPENWIPPPSLQDFLRKGNPPICIGFGSMNDKDIPKLYEQMIGVLEKNNIRGIVLSGWSGIQSKLSKYSDNIYVAEKLPHNWLLPKVQAIIHHGGAGTSAAALKAGTPSIVVPFFYDQFFWANRLAEIGVAPPSLARRKFSFKQFEETLLKVLNDREIRQKTKRIAQFIKGENGVERAITILENYLSKEQGKNNFSTTIIPTLKALPIGN